MIAGYLGGRKVDAARLTDAKLMPNQCPTNPPIDSLSASPLWNGWSPDASNNRLQPAKAAGLSADEVPKLKLKWAFGFRRPKSCGASRRCRRPRFHRRGYGRGVFDRCGDGCVYWSFRLTRACATRRVWRR